MIKTVTVTNELSESVVLDLRNPAPSGFFIRSITGLGPPKGVINTTESLLLDGSSYNSARATQRNIVLNIGFLENESIEESRQNTYIYFPVKGRVELVIETDQRTVKTHGYVESNEPDIFSKDSGSTISIICPQAYLLGLNTVITNFSNIESLFEFPFSNESMTEKLIVFGNILSDTQKNIVYSGEATTGFVMIVDVSGPVDNFIIWNLQTAENMSISTDILVALTTSGLIAGDRVIINTRRGEKSVTLIRDGLEINILNALGPNSAWFKLKKGDNVFYYTADSGVTNLSFIIEHELVYEGI